jgi:FkbM family methyltransferase
VINGLKKAVLKKVWWTLHRRGYDVRKAEEHCWPDQAALLTGAAPAEIFDIGANAGEIAKVYRAMFPMARVHCFEPMPATCAVLRGRFGADERVWINEVAVGDVEGEVSFVVNAAADTSSLLPVDLEAVPTSYRETMASSQKITAPLVTVDAYCTRHGIKMIDMLKLDIQGGNFTPYVGQNKCCESRRCA